MLTINQNNPFQATWNDANNKLNPNKGDCLERTIRKIKNFIFYIPNSLIACCVNPRPESTYTPSRTVEQDQGTISFRKEIITPDEVHLQANVHIIENSNTHTPTIILFNPLGTSDSVHRNLKNALLNKMCNVITFDYRGLGSTWRAKDLVVDGESVYQYVTNELGITANKVHFYGHSLGGAIAAQVKALHPESQGKYVGDRTFKSVKLFLASNCSLTRFGQLLQQITFIISYIFLTFPIYILGWEWDGGQALSIMHGEKRIIYHPNDGLIPFRASLAAVSKDNTKETIRLDSHVTSFSGTHFPPIDQHQTDEDNSALEVVTNFLMPENLH